MRTIKGNKVTWIDILKPNEEDIRSLAKVHKFHPLILDELLNPSNRMRIERHDGYLFLVYVFPEYDQISKTSHPAEINFLITKNTVITFHYENLETLNQLFDTFSRNEKECNRVLGTDTLLATYYAFEKAIGFSLRQLRHIEEQVTDIAEHIFAGQEEEMLRTISYVKRNILDYRLITRSHDSFFQQLRDIGLLFWGQKSSVYLADLIDESVPVQRNLESYFETIESLENTNTQLLEASTNRIIKRFTVIAFLFWIPFYFVFFADFSYIHDLVAATAVRFWTFFVLIHALVVALWIYFRKKRYF